jgi:hypothetical protein
MAKQVITYSWHKDVYDKAIKQMAEGAGKKYAAFIDDHGPVETGWMEWFETNHPNLYAKYVKAVERITSIWGCNDNTPAGKEKFRQAVKIEVEATKWAVDKYIEAKRLAVINNA